MSVPDFYKVIWYHAAGKYPEVYFDQIKATLYGSTGVIVIGESIPMKPCLYFTFSEFYRYKDSLDAAIVTYGRNAQFCLNNHSPN